MYSRDEICRLHEQGVSKAEIARMAGLSRERIGQIIGKSSEAAKKANARVKLSYAVKSGKIVKEPCRECGDPDTEAHHEDYDKPLDVIWLCGKHHDKLHKTQSSGKYHKNENGKSSPFSIRLDLDVKLWIDENIPEGKRAEFINGLARDYFLRQMELTRKGLQIKKEVNKG